MKISTAAPARHQLAFIATALTLTTFSGAAPAHADVRIVALGDSAIRGKGVPENENYPAQLEAALRARGHRVSVVNQGVNGDTTGGVLARIDNAVPKGTDIVILKVGANDRVLHHLSRGYIGGQLDAIEARLRERAADIYVLNGRANDLVDRADLHVEKVHDPSKTEWHLNAAGYAILVRRTLPAIEAMVKKAERHSR